MTESQSQSKIKARVKDESFLEKLVREHLVELSLSMKTTTICSYKKFPKATPF